MSTTSRRASLPCLLALLVGGCGEAQTQPPVAPVMASASRARPAARRPPPRPQRKPVPHQNPRAQRDAALRHLLTRLPAVTPRHLTPALVSQLVRLSIECSVQEYPNKPSDVQSGPGDVRPPRGLHPAFFGCFDWHSAVHGHWAMARVLKIYPRLKEAPAIRRRLNQHLTAARMAGEVAYFRAKHRLLFERPYGWAWFLRLATELVGWNDPDAKRWARAIKPLEQLLVQRIQTYLSRLSVPVRAGTHASTAFALAHIHDYAVGTGNAALRSAVERAARRYYAADRDCPTQYEPSGEDFISPCLAEADLMRRVLPPAVFRRWLARFLPPLASPRFASIRRPPTVLDRKDPRLGHLIGLSLQRAWALRGVARALGPRDPRQPVLLRIANIHTEDALRQMFDSGYGGAHWLASFALYLMTDGGSR